MMSIGAIGEIPTENMQDTFSRHTGTPKGGRTP